MNNLSFKVSTEEELREAFESRFGEVKQAHLVLDEHGRSKGYGFVQFVEEASMSKALREKEVMIKDRLAIVKMSTRQITPAPASHAPKEASGKKRESKRERKRVLADIVTEATAEERVENAAVEVEVPK